MFTVILESVLFAINFPNLYFMLIYVIPYAKQNTLVLSSFLTIYYTNYGITILWHL